jgi:hypothetical protein
MTVVDQATASQKACIGYLSHLRARQAEHRLRIPAVVRDGIEGGEQRTVAIALEQTHRGTFLRDLGRACFRNNNIL